MIALGGVHLVYLLISRGGARNLAIPDLRSIDLDTATKAHEGSEGA